jgi:hypothetical protein
VRPVSYLDDLIAAYGKSVALPWPGSLAPGQRVWMAVYPPEQERRLRLHLPAFKEETLKHGHSWAQVDLTHAFEAWTAEHPYRVEYFKAPELFASALPSFFEHLVDSVRAQLAAHDSPDGVVALVGAGSLFGLGEAVKVSALLAAVSDAIAGRLLVFFPGDVESNNFRLLDGRDGWNYMAIVIKPDGGRR